MLLVVRPGAPSSILAPSSDALVISSFLFLGLTEKFGGFGWVEGSLGKSSLLRTWVWAE